MEKYVFVVLLILVIFAFIKVCSNLFNRKGYESVLEQKNSGQAQKSSKQLFLESEHALEKEEFEKFIALRALANVKNKEKRT